MTDHRRSRSLKRVLFLILFVCGITLAQVKQENRTLVVNGQTGEALVLQINGQLYVDLAAVARIGSGRVDFRSNQIILTLNSSAPSAPTTPPEPETPPQSQLSRNFSMAGIEAIAQMREWATTLAYAIQNGYGVTDTWVAGYREQAAHSLKLARTAASTPGDNEALQLLTNEFEAVKEGSDKLLEAKKRMDTAKYSASPQALREEPLSQKIINCGRFLGSMLGSREFKDDPSCH